MSLRISRRPRPPSERGSTVGDFFPAEVVKILGLHGIDYRQLRTLASVACPALVQSQRWTRYQFRDLIAIRVAFELAGGHAAIRAGRRLRFKRVRAACEMLRTRFGLTDPLVQVQLKLRGGAIHAHYEGIDLRPADGQLSFVFEEVRAYPALDQPRTLVQAALRRERDRIARAHRKLASSGKVRTWAL